MEFLINLDVSTYVYIGLLLFLTTGILYKDKPKNIKDYAIGASPFGTPALVATMVATFIGAGNTVGYVTLFYKNGLLFTLLPVCGCLAHLLFARYILPQFDDCYGKLSIVAVVVKIYGNSVKKYVGFIAYAYCFGVLTMQIKAIGIIIEYALGYPSVLAVMLSFMVMIVYSAVGGIKSVVRTDVLQFLIFIVVLPIFAFFLLEENSVASHLTEYDMWKVRENFNLLSYISLLALSLSPEISPIFIHRILIGRNQMQNRKTIYFWILIKIICTLFTVVVATVAISKFSGVESNLIFFKTIENVIENNFLRGVFAVTMLAVVLSSADSLINTGAVIFAENLIPKAVIGKINKVNIAKIMTLLSGFLGLFIAIKARSLLDIVFFVSEYYFTTLFIPFVGGLFIKKGKPVIFWASSIAGFLSHTLLKVLVPEIENAAYLISLILSFAAFILTKYLVQDRTNMEGGYIVNLGQVTKNIIEEIRIPVSQLGYVIIPIPIFTIVISIIGDSQSKGRIILIILSGLISMVYIFIDKIFKNNQGVLHHCLILFTTWYCFPFLSTYVYYTLPNSNVAFANMVIASTLMTVIFSARIAFIFMTSGALLGSLLFFILSPTNFMIFISHSIILGLIVLYIGVIVYFIFRTKEEGVKKFISEITRINSQDSSYKSSDILKEYSRIIEVAKKHERAKKFFLEKKAEFIGQVKSNEIISTSMKELVEMLKDYLSLVELEKGIKFDIQSKIKNMTTNMLRSEVCMVIFSIAYQMIGFKGKLNMILVSSKDDHVFIKYSLPNLELSVLDVKRYIRGINSPKEVINFSLIEKIIDEQNSMKITINKKSMTLVIALGSININNESEKIAQFFLSKNEKPKLLN